MMPSPPSPLYLAPPSPLSHLTPLPDDDVAPFANKSLPSLPTLSPPQRYYSQAGAAATQRQRSHSSSSSRHSPLASPTPEPLFPAHRAPHATTLALRPVGGAAYVVFADNDRILEFKPRLLSRSVIKITDRAGNAVATLRRSPPAKDGAACRSRAVLADAADVEAATLHCGDGAVDVLVQSRGERLTLAAGDGEAPLLTHNGGAVLAACEAPLVPDELCTCQVEAGGDLCLVASVLVAAALALRDAPPGDDSPGEDARRRSGSLGGARHRRPSSVGRARIGLGIGATGDAVP